VARLGGHRGRLDPHARAPSRWNATKDLSWEPLRPELVAEVAYEHLQRDRFRHTARFVRWRHDRDPRRAPTRSSRRPCPSNCTACSAANGRNGRPLERDGVRAEIRDPGDTPVQNRVLRGEETSIVVRVLIVDDHRMFAESLVRLLDDEDDFEVLDIASSVDDARRLAAEQHPDVALVDYLLPTETARPPRSSCGVSIPA